MSIHKEGYKTLLYTFFTLLVLNGTLFLLFPAYAALLLPVGLVSLVLFLLILFFFRKPNRLINKGEEKVIAPADGLVVAVEEVEDSEYFSEKRIQVSIFMSMLNVHMNLCPIAGTVSYLKYHPGRYLVAMHPKSSLKNERTTTVIENGEQAILVRQIAGGIARRVVTYPVPGDRVDQGEELGFIKFGSRVDLLLPLHAQVQVKLGRKVRAGKTVIATLS